MTNRDAYLEHIKTQLPTNPKVLEIGVEAGYFSKQLLDVLNPSELHLLDPWEVNPFNGKIYSEGHMKNVPTAHSNVNMQIKIERTYEEEIKNGKIHIHRGYSYELADRFDPEYFDFIYLDGCHLYESVKQDLIDYIPKIKPQGVFGGHDYISKETLFTQEGVVYTNQLGYGIKQAVDEFLSCRPDLEMIVLVSDDIPFPDWAIRRKQ